MKRDNLGWIGLCALVGALTACDGGETADAGLDAAMDARVPDATAPDSATPDAGHDASTDAGPSLGGIGAACTDGADCESGLCFPTGFGAGRCTEACAAVGDCPAGWGCDSFGGEMACVCEASAELCNGEDDDCDAVVDEGDGALLGCSSGEICSAGACGCPPERTCPGEMGCVDLSRDAANCGACGNDCGSGGICTDGSCCMPSAERCDGFDDDCDGFVDESTSAECAAMDGICIDGSCACPPALRCDGSCTDTLSDSNNCGGCGVRCAATEVCASGVCCEAAGAPVDILFMVDNSNSMTEEQRSLAASLPRVVEVLATGDLDGDGTPERTPARDLHVGVITSDMGTGGFSVPTCPRSDFGDDGVLRTQGRTDITGCMATYPSFLAFDPAGSVTPADFAADFACVAEVGTGGCGFEQQLEATLKAITPSTAPTTFFRMTAGHGDASNAGFLRADSIFVSLILTDENDCSASDPDLFNPSSTRYGATDLNLRCFAHPGALHGLSRYVSGLLALRADPRDVIFAPIVGIPVDLEGASPPAMLADPRMMEQTDPSNPNRLLPSCNVPGRGQAFPPRRIVRVAEEIQRAGGQIAIGSICQTSYDRAIDGILTRVLDRLGGVCGP